MLFWRQWVSGTRWLCSKAENESLTTLKRMLVKKVPETSKLGSTGHLLRQGTVENSTYP
jgi:hypothetical protein